MGKSNYIRSGISVMLLFMFALSITPKKILHDLVADHRDKPSATNTGNHTHSIDNAGYHCNVDNLVAESPFVNSITPLEIKLTALFVSYNEKALYSFYSLHHFFSELRGPPAFILPV